MALTQSADSSAPAQMSNQDEEDRSLYAMTVAYYSSHSHSGHNVMRGGTDESSSLASSFDLSREDVTADSSSMPPQALAYNNQYMGAYPPVGWYAPPLPPTSSHYNYHPAAHHPMYPAYHVPSSYSSAPSAQYQHMQYPSNNEYPTRLGRAKVDYFNESNEDFILTGDRQRDLRSALYYVRKNPSATLHDIDGKCLLVSVLLCSINLVALTLCS